MILRTKTVQIDKNSLKFHSHLAKIDRSPKMSKISNPKNDLIFQNLLLLAYLGGESSLLVMMGSAVNLRVLGDVESTSPEGIDGEASNSTEIVTFGVTTLVLIRF